MILSTFFSYLSVKEILQQYEAYTLSQHNLSHSLNSICLIQCVFAQLVHHQHQPLMSSSGN